jgi:hypothetical protein
MWQKLMSLLLKYIGNAMLNLEDIFPGNILETIHHTVYLLWVNLAALFISASAIMLSSLFFLLGSDKKERSPLLP